MFTSVNDIGIRLFWFFFILIQWDGYKYLLFILWVFYVLTFLKTPILLGFFDRGWMYLFEKWICYIVTFSVRIWTADERVTRWLFGRKLITFMLVTSSYYYYRFNIIFHYWLCIPIQGLLSNYGLNVCF